MKPKKIVHHLRRRFVPNVRLRWPYAVAGLATVYLAVLALFFFDRSVQRSTRATACRSQGSQWVTVVSMRKDLQFRFPCAPRPHTTHLPGISALGSVTQEQYTALGQDATRYSLTILRYPAETELQQEKGFLDDFLQGLLEENPGGELVNAFTTTVDGHGAIEYQIRNNGTRLYLQGRTFIRGNVLYTALAANTTGVFSDAGYSTLVRSLDVREVR